MYVCLDGAARERSFFGAVCRRRRRRAAPSPANGMPVVAALLPKIVALAPDQQRRCNGASRYSPSGLESEWFTRNPDAIVGSLCKVARRQAARKRSSVSTWLEYVKASVGEQSRSPTALEAAVLSKLACADGRQEYLEPLTGMARHPLAQVGCKVDEAKHGVVFSAGLFDINYLVLHNQCGRRRANASRTAHGHRQNLFYDLGASAYAGAVDLDNGFGLGPSVPLFYGLYQRNCIEFDRIWAFEYSKFDPQDYWRAVPAQMRGKLTFLNIPVPLEPDSNGVLSLLEATAKPQDFVVLKVDIDNGPIEESIVRAIARNPRLADLVDELFFEYHFYGEPPEFSFGWGTRNDPAQPSSWTNATVATALGLMRELREAGIRSHFWI